MEKTLPFRAKRKQVQQKSFKFGKRQTTVKDAVGVGTVGWRGKSVLDCF